MVEIFYKTYYYILISFLIIIVYIYFIEIIHLRTVLWKQKRKCCGTAAEKLTGVFIILRVLYGASHRHWRKAGISEKR